MQSELHKMVLIQITLEQIAVWWCLINVLLRVNGGTIQLQDAMSTASSQYYVYSCLGGIDTFS